RGGSAARQRCWRRNSYPTTDIFLLPHGFFYKCTVIRIFLVNAQLFELVPQRPESNAQRRGGTRLVVAVFLQGVLDGGALDLLDVRGQGAGGGVARVDGARVDAGGGGVGLRGAGHHRGGAALRLGQAQVVGVEALALGQGQ